MKQKLAVVAIAVLAVVAIVFGVLYFTNNADKTKAIDALTADKAVLTEDVAAKTEQIAALEGEKEQQAADYATAIEGKDGEITALTGEKEQLIADHAAVIEQKDAEIAALTADKDALAAEKEQLIADHATAIETKDGEIAALTADKDALAAEKEQLVADHAAAIEAKDAEIATLKEENAALNNRVAELEAAAVVAEPAASEAFSLVGEWKIIIDENYLQQQGISKEDYAMLESMGFEMIMVFDANGYAWIDAYMGGQSVGDPVEPAQYEVMGDKIRFNNAVHNLIIDGETVQIVSNSTNIKLIRK